MIHKNLKKFITVYMILVSLMVVHTAFGTEDLPGVDITIQDVAGIITGIACWLIRIVLAIMVIFLLISGIKFLLARGDPDKLNAAKKNFYLVLVGILIILATNVIIATVADFVAEGGQGGQCINNACSNDGSLCSFDNECGSGGGFTFIGLQC